MQKLMTACLLLSVTLAPDYASCAGKKKATTAKVSKQEAGFQGKYSVDAINMETDKLPIGYMGHDISLIYEKLRSRSELFKKMEFETTLDFNHRLKKEHASTIIGNLTDSGLFALTLLPERLSKRGKNEKIDKDALYNYHDVGVEFEYNADSSLLKLSPKTGLCENKISTTTCLVSTTNILRYPDYVGTNAMGVSANVRKSVHNNYLLELYETKESDLTVNFDAISAEQARSYKGNLAILVIYKLKEPYISTRMLEHKPTIAEQYDLTVFRNYVLSEMVEVWVYNFRNGTILKKVKLPS